MNNRNFKCKIANRLWQITNFPLTRRYNRALSKCEYVQKRYLFHLLRRNAKTIYGKKFKFSHITSIKQFQDSIPLTRYEDYVPYIDLISKGEKSVLTNEDVLLFEPSSGSTSSHKLIPYTKSLKYEFHNAIAPWISSLYRQIPEVVDGRAYWSISPSNKIQSRHGNIPVRFDHDSSYLGFLGKKLFSHITVEPKNMMFQYDITTFRNQTLACLLSAKDLALISVWSPSFLRILLDWYFEHANEIFGLMKKIYPKAVNQRIKELNQLGKDQSVFERIWPQLRVVSCWIDATSKNEALHLKKYFPNTYIQGKGLLATEAFVSFPYMAEYDPVLAVNSHFFEFKNEDGICLLAHELEKGCSYSVIVTTGGGLYRYDLEDQVLVTGFIGNTPTLRFLGKSGNISDKYGEKINEFHVSKVISSTLKPFTYNFCMLAPDSRGNKQFYTLYIESEQTLPEGIADLVEDKLRENYNYRYCIDIGQLQPVRIFRIAKDAYNAYEARCLTQGQKQGDLKLAHLSKLDRWSDYFQGDYV